jgi:uncharacterized membrane protein
MWSKRIAIIAIVLGCFGLIDSGYLTIKHLEGSFIRCGDDCSAVLGSKYAEGIAGVPLAGFGAMAYVSVIAAALFAAAGSIRARQVFAVLAASMALFSVWLIYLQGFVIHSFCRYCLASAATSFALAGLALIERLQRGHGVESQDAKGAK